MPEPKKERIHSFKNPREFQNWLEVNHASEPELWLKIFKNGSGQETISWNEAVIEALCWGWIDGIKKPLDASAFLQRFTPRRSGSNWSKRNRENVEQLIKEGKLREPGLNHVLAAQSDGRWESAYAPASEMTVPNDFIEALEKFPDAKKFFDSLNKQNLYSIAYRLQTAKKPETRIKRFNQLLTMLKNKEKLH